MGNERGSSEDAWVTANCAYLVVIVISVTRLDVLLSCEAAAVGKQISYIHATLWRLYEECFVCGVCEYDQFYFKACVKQT